MDKSQLSAQLKKELTCGNKKLSNRDLLFFLFSCVFSEDDCKKVCDEFYEKLFQNGGLFQNSKIHIRSVNCSEEQEAFVEALIQLHGASQGVKRIDSHHEAGEFFRDYIGFLPVEGMYMLCMTEENLVISVSEIAKGDAGSIFIDIDALVRKAVEARAKKVIIAHNHTSRYMKYSIEDFHTTEKLCAYFSKAGITLMEHFVVNKESYHGILYDLSDTDKWKQKLCNNNPYIKDSF